MLQSQHKHATGTDIHLTDLFCVNKVSLPCKPMPDKLIIKLTYFTQQQLGYKFNVHRIEGLFLAEAEIFIFSAASKPVMRPTLPPI
jgi:hypothetical protein